MDNQTSDQQMVDIKQAHSIRSIAERQDKRGNKVTAIFFHNDAWRIEQGKEWLDYSNLKETQ
jgi:hypothetical protein